MNLRKDHCRTLETERPENDETSLSVGRFLTVPADFVVMRSSLAKTSVLVGVLTGGRARRGNEWCSRKQGVPTSRGGAGREGAAPAMRNDPSAGSPTETLLRLLLPLNDRV